MLRSKEFLLTDDDSFVESSEEIDDYVLSCQGVIWRGNYRQKLAIYWDYGQVGSKKIKCVLKNLNYSMKREVLKVLCFCSPL